MVQRKKTDKKIWHVALRCMLVLACLGRGMAAWAQDEAEAGKIEAGIELTSELQATHTGKFNNANLLRLRAALTLGKGLSLHVATLSAFMTSKESIGDDMQAFSNLDAGNIPLALSKCGLEWQPADGHSLFGGVLNMNEDYFASPVTSFFTNSSCGIYPTISANYSIANYPLASVGMHYRYEHRYNNDNDNHDDGDDDDDGRSLVVQASLFNGTGYNRFAGHDNVFRFCPKSDGIFVLAEAQYHSKGSSYFVGNAVHHNTNTCATPWLYAEQHIGSGLTLLAGYSHAFGSTPSCRDFAGLGLHYGRGSYELGIFSDYASFAACNEFATELTCKMQFFPLLSIQPVVHLITTQGTFRAIAALRLCLSL